MTNVVRFGQVGSNALSGRTGSGKIFGDTDFCLWTGTENYLAKMLIRSVGIQTKSSVDSIKIEIWDWDEGTSPVKKDGPHSLETTNSDADFKNWSYKWSLPGFDCRTKQQSDHYVAVLKLDDNEGTADINSLPWGEKDLYRVILNVVQKEWPFIELRSEDFIIVVENGDLLFKRVAEGSVEHGRQLCTSRRRMVC